MISNYFVRNVEELMIMENLHLRKEVYFVEHVMILLRLFLHQQDKNNNTIKFYFFLVNFLTNYNSKITFLLQSKITLFYRKKICLEIMIMIMIMMIIRRRLTLRNSFMLLLKG